MTEIETNTETDENDLYSIAWSCSCCTEKLTQVSNEFCIHFIGICIGLGVRRCQWTITAHLRLTSKKENILVLLWVAFLFQYLCSIQWKLCYLSHAIGSWVEDAKFLVFRWRHNEASLGIPAKTLYDVSVLVQVWNQRCTSVNTAYLMGHPSDRKISFCPKQVIVWSLFRLILSTLILISIANNSIGCEKWKQFTRWTSLDIHFVTSQARWPRITLVSRDFPTSITIGRKSLPYFCEDVSTSKTLTEFCVEKAMMLSAAGCHCTTSTSYPPGPASRPVRSKTLSTCPLVANSKSWPAMGNEKAGEFGTS